MNDELDLPELLAKIAVLEHQLETITENRDWWLKEAAEYRSRYALIKTFIYQAVSLMEEMENAKDKEEGKTGCDSSQCQSAEEKGAKTREENGPC